MKILADIQIPLDEVMKILGWMIGIVLALGGIIAGFVKMLHSDVKKSIDGIHDDLKPLILDVDRLKGDVINIKEDHKDLTKVVEEQDKWIRHHDTRIQGVERTLATITGK